MLRQVRKKQKQEEPRKTREYQFVQPYLNDLSLCACGAGASFGAQYWHQNLVQTLEVGWKRDGGGQQGLYNGRIARCFVFCVFLLWLVCFYTF